MTKGTEDRSIAYKFGTHWPAIDHRQYGDFPLVAANLER